MPRHEFLTANNQVPYMITFVNLRQGPIVVEIPAAGAKAVLFGSFVDNWQAPVVDVGPSLFDAVGRNHHEHPQGRQVAGDRFHRMNRLLATLLGPSLCAPFRHRLRS